MSVELPEGCIAHIFEGDYIQIFEYRIPPHPALRRNFTIFNKKLMNQLGWINWYHPWRKYVFTSIDDYIFYDMDCLNDIIRTMALITEQETKD